MGRTPSPGVLETGARAVALDDAVKDLHLRASWALRFAGGEASGHAAGGRHRIRPPYDAGAPAGSWRQLSMGPVYCTELTLEDVVEMNRAAHR
jgi:hypothetical protein